MPEVTPFRRKRRGQPILTPKELRFLKTFIKTGNQRLSARSAGYSAANPDQSASRVMKQLRHLEEVLRKSLVPGLKAKKTEFFAQAGIVMETREVVDHEQRGKSFDRFCKLLGLYGNE